MVDWKMIFPDGSVGVAFSRVTPDGDRRSIYSFVLMAPPVPLEALEGALRAQRVTLADELMRLKGILEEQWSRVERDRAAAILMRSNPSFTTDVGRLVMDAIGAETDHWQPKSGSYGLRSAGWG